jgi:CheY-like chemotaxis protein
VKPRVLVVDNDRDQVDLLVAALGQEGHEVAGPSSRARTSASSAPPGAVQASSSGTLPTAWSW